ncbi:hypothetical protein C2G38_2027510 [Gigaspora rosea]|uniref:Uncharacterized protein n=1 Tax=Gigaspora rosea TaxID=44941 RepID=A0A397W4W4_9GLOM|nr:hypothetical protein C2G38_2027510 [Gigaspora rosea]
MLHSNNQEVSNHVVIPVRRTLAKRIHKTMIIYIQDLNRGDPQEPILPFKVPGEDWDERLAYCYQAIIRLNPRLRTNAHVLETYYQLGSIMAEKEWGETAKRKLRLISQWGKEKLSQKCRREYINSLLPGEWYMYLVEHVTIFILEKIYGRILLIIY